MTNKPNTLTLQAQELKAAHAIAQDYLDKYLTATDKGDRKRADWAWNKYQEASDYRDSVRKGIEELKQLKDPKPCSPQQAKARIRTYAKNQLEMTTQIDVLVQEAHHEIVAEVFKGDFDMVDNMNLHDFIIREVREYVTKNI